MAKVGFLETLKGPDEEYIIPVLPLEFNRVQKKTPKLRSLSVRIEPNGYCKGLPCVHVRDERLAKEIWTAFGDPQVIDMIPSQIARVAI